MRIWELMRVNADLGDNATTVLEKKMNGTSETLSEVFSQTKNVLEIFKNGITNKQTDAGASVVVSGGP